MKNEFKVGMKVERISGFWEGMKVGDISTIVGIKDSGCVILREFPGETGRAGHGIEHLKVIGYDELNLDF